MLTELAQGLLGVALAAVTARLIGLTGYVIVGVTVSLVCMALLANIAHDRLQASPVLEEPPDLLRTTFEIVLTSVMFGGLWPLIPPVLAWGSWRESKLD